MSMAELVAAGAPELPEGWFYRVRPECGIGLKVQIREQRRWGSRWHADAWVREDRHPDALVAIVAACVRAHTSLRYDLERYERARAAFRFIGDHDPRGGR